MSEKFALISVYNKDGIVEFAKGIQKYGYDIISSGGTAKVLKEAGLEVKGLEEVTGFPEMLDGRIKTLHPKIHAGILAIRSNKMHMEKLREHKILPIDLVVVNLYPFKETVTKPNATSEEIIENIDIGGPAMIRAAAKNFHDVAVIVNPARYNDVIKELEEKGKIYHEMRDKLAKEAFEHTAHYDALIAAYFQKEQNDILPSLYTRTFEKAQETRYGENPHQKAAFYREPILEGTSIANAVQLQGKELSFNNIHDANAALALAMEFKEPAAVIVKHTNPCGVAQDDDLADAFQDALDCDPKSAFGGVIALNKICTKEVAEKITSFFNEIVIAPDFEQEAIKILGEKENLRVLKTGTLSPTQGRDIKNITGGLLVQETDSHKIDQTRLEFVSKRKPSAEELEGLLFAWNVAKHVKSNAIVLCKGRKTVGVGAGQMSRVDSAKIAVEKAGERAKGSVMASDGFFPFRDSIDAAAKEGITAVIEPGGSIKDKEVIEAANEHDISLVFTGIRHFRH